MSLFQKQRHTTTCLLLVLLGGCSTNQPPSSSSHPAGAAEIVFVEQEHDFGEVRPGRELKHSFVFFNAGDVPLEIEVSSDCGCTVGQVDKKIVGPDESSEIAVAFTVQAPRQKHRTAKV